VINGDGMLRVEFGTASDEQSSPVSYTVYWQLGNTGVNKTQPTGWTANAVSPFIIDNLTNDEIYSVFVTASDNANPPNETQNTTYMLGMPTTGGSSDLEAPIWRDVDESGIKDVVPGDGDVRVSWYLADDAGTPPVTYNVYWEENDGTSPLDYETAVLADRAMIGVAGDNVLVNGLVNGRSYRFSVRAQDSATPPNVTQNTESLTAAPVPGGDTNPPYWVGAPGIQSAVAGSRQVTLSWNSATDLEGNGVFYNFYWELDTGVGPLDYVAARSAQPPRFERTSETSGIVFNLTNGNSYRFAARTVDSLGNEDTNEVSLTAIPVFTGVVSITTVDNTGDTGYMPSIAASPSGEFGIAYFNRTNGELRYATAPSRTGTWTIDIIDNTAGQVRGAFPSLTYDVLGHPYIAYLDWTHAEDTTPGTRVLYTTNNGTSWSSPEVVAGAGVQGYDDFFDAPRISLDATGVPYVSFVDTTTEELVVAKRQGAGSWTTGRPFAAGPAELRGTLIADIVFFNPGTGATYGVAWHEPADGITFAYYDTAALDYVWEVVGSGAPNDGLYIDLAVNGIGRPVATWMNNVSAPLSLPMYAVRRGANDWAVENVDVPFTNSGVSTGVAIKAVTGVPAGLPAVAWFTPGVLGGRFALDDLANPGFQTPSTFDPLATRDGFLLGICADNGSGLPGKCLIAYTAPAGALAKLNVAVEN
jgi:hypothetical protein